MRGLPLCFEGCGVQHNHHAKTETIPGSGRCLLVLLILLLARTQTGEPMLRHKAHGDRVHEEPERKRAEREHNVQRERRKDEQDRAKREAEERRREEEERLREEEARERKEEAKLRGKEIGRQRALVREVERERQALERERELGRGGAWRRQQQHRPDEEPQRRGSARATSRER